MERPASFANAGGRDGIYPAHDGHTQRVAKSMEPSGKGVSSLTRWNTQLFISTRLRLATSRCPLAASTSGVCRPWARRTGPQRPLSATHVEANGIFRQDPPGNRSKYLPETAHATRARRPTTRSKACHSCRNPRRSL